MRRGVSLELMKLLGITGGVGMGKSTAQSILAERSVPVIDTDELARILVAPDQPALLQILTTFGTGFLTADGHLDRAAMARLVFSEPTARRRLESILHPRIRECWITEVEQWKAEGMVLGAVVIPLLFETDAASSFDATVCVACSAPAQLERLMARGWNEEEIQQRIAAQWPVGKKIATADRVVWTDGDLEAHASQWDRILTSL